MLCIGITKNKSKKYIDFPWKIGIVGFMAYPNLLKGQDVEETIRELVEDPFFDVLELNFIDEKNWEKIKGVVEDSNKEVTLALQPFTLSQEGNISSLNEKTRLKAVEEVKKMVTISAKRGMKVVALSSGSNIENGRRKEAMEKLAKSLSEVCRHAEQNEVRILLETFDTTYDKNQLIGSLEEARDVINEVRKEHKNVGVLWDLSHGPFLNEKPTKLLNFKEILAHVHIGCAKRVENTLKDWHPSFYRNGAVNGIEDLVELFSTLEKINYSGAISFEVKPEENQQTQEVIDISKGVLHTAFSKYIRDKK